MLDFRVETFLCVCRHMNFTRAAEELCITQPSVSQHIRYLEEYYGARLFSYSGRRLCLTEQGEFLKNAFEAFFHDAARVREDVKNIRGRQVLRIGATLSIGEFFLPQRLGKFMASRPELDLSLTVADTRALLEKLDGGEIDLALCEGYFKKSDYSCRLIKTEPVCALCAADYPMGNVSSISELFAHRLIIREQGSGTREILERGLSEKGYSVDCFASRWDITSPHIILKLVEEGQGITFLYRECAQKLLRENVLREIVIPDFSVCHEFNAIWMQGSIYNSYYSECAELLCN